MWNQPCASRPSVVSCTSRGHVAPSSRGARKRVRRQTKVVTWCVANMTVLRFPTGACALPHFSYPSHVLAFCRNPPVSSAVGAALTSHLLLLQLSSLSHLCCLRLELPKSHPSYKGFYLTGPAESVGFHNIPRVSPAVGCSQTIQKKVIRYKLLFVPLSCRRGFGHIATWLLALYLLLHVEISYEKAKKNSPVLLKRKMLANQPLHLPSSLRS